MILLNYLYRQERSVEYLLQFVKSFECRVRFVRVFKSLILLVSHTGFFLTPLFENVRHELSLILLRKRLFCDALILLEMIIILGLNLKKKADKDPK